jgi:hypothetical protein
MSYSFSYILQMITDIFIKTYHKDFVWLEWCLKSIKKFASGFRNIIIVTEDDGNVVPNDYLRIIPVKVFYVAFPDKTPSVVEHGVGYLWQQYIKLTWYNYSDADAVLILDSDEMLTRRTTPENFKFNGKSVWYYREWKDAGDGICWKAPTDRLLQIDTKYDAMRITGFLLNKETTLNLKKYLCERNDTQDIWDIFVKLDMATCSEFNLFGSYILLSNDETYHKSFKDDISNSFNNTIKKDWSWGGMNEEIIAERCKILSHKITETVAFITLTNTGYIDYTLNCLKSLENIKSPDLPQIYCIGADGVQKLQSLGYHAELINEEKNSNFQIIRTGNWSNIVYHKFEIIHKNLLTHDFVCITDGDIVYKNHKFMKFLLNKIGSRELLIQNDMLSNDKTDTLCSGFMFIKSTQNTVSLFDPINVKEFRDKEGWGDQIYINSIKDRFNYKALPLELFPNGRFYYENHEKIRPYLVHFNWVKGNEKKEKMKKYGVWFNLSCG